MRPKISSGARWSTQDFALLKSSIEGGLTLSECQTLFPHRSNDAIIGQAHKMGYSECKLENGDKTFVGEKRSRSTSAVVPTEKEVSKQSDSAENLENQHNVILPKNGAINGKEITTNALQILETYQLLITPKSVKQISNILIEYRAEV